MGCSCQFLVLGGGFGISGFPDWLHSACDFGWCGCLVVLVVWVCWFGWFGWYLFD